MARESVSLYLRTARPGCWWPIGEVTGKFDGLGRFTEGFVQTLWTFLLLPKGPFGVIHRVVYTIAGIVVHVNIVQGEIPIPTGDNNAMSYACVHVRIECCPTLMAPTSIECRDRILQSDRTSNIGKVHSVRCGVEHGDVFEERIDEIVEYCQRGVTFGIRPKVHVCSHAGVEHVHVLEDRSLRVTLVEEWGCRIGYLWNVREFVQLKRPFEHETAPVEDGQRIEEAIALQAKVAFAV